MCDVCGRRRPGSKFRVVDGIWICDLNNSHNGYIPESVLERVPYVNTKGPEPIKDAKPYAPHDTFEAREADLLNFVCAQAPYGEFNVTASKEAGAPANSVRGAAWAALYLYDIIAEATRPVRWVTQATTKLRVLADYLLTRQCGGAYADSEIATAIGTTATTDLEYGGFVSLVADPTSTIGSVYSEDVGAAGLALLRAYQTLGDAKYQDGYRAALTCLRRMQCGGKLTTRYATTSLTGEARLNTGMWTHKLDIIDYSGGAASFGAGACSAGGAVGGPTRLIIDGGHYGTISEGEANEVSLMTGDKRLVRSRRVDLRYTGSARLRLNYQVVLQSDAIAGGGNTLTWRVHFGTAGDNGLETDSTDAVVCTFSETADGTVRQFSGSADVANPAALAYLSLYVSSPVDFDPGDDALTLGFTCTLESY